MLKKVAAIAVGGFAVAELLLAMYFSKRTIVRSKAKVEDTMKMAGTDWSQYFEGIERDRD